MAKLLQIAQLGHPVLRKTAARVEDVKEAAIQSLIEDMMVTVADVNGVGIAAPQVYESSRIFIMASRPNPRYPHAPEMEPAALINPEILETSKEKEKGWEGCLSIPGIRAMVPRYTSVTVRFSTVNGEERETRFTDFLARIFQHESDHLNGKVFLDRVESNEEIVTEKEFLRILSGKN
ncbi:peptide deformylase [Desulfospira joergensenii]|uniref:peptide deformylase n=1 Tax=Desulfospira joergensenii TaxID=53329 RepID=UPI0003B7AF57|nr:peptide deformylase [Desulfospira joergensenii]